MCFGGFHPAKNVEVAPILLVGLHFLGAVANQPVRCGIKAGAKEGLHIC
jgi:hypothetical protein